MLKFFSDGSNKSEDLFFEKEKEVESKFSNIFTVVILILIKYNQKQCFSYYTIYQKKNSTPRT
jgi:hypothetical protein